MRFARTAALAATWMMLAGEARANGRFPAAGQIVTTATDPSFVVARTTFGVLVSRDRAATWDWVCEAATGSQGSQDPALGLLDGRHLIAGMYEGLSVSIDGGCDWHLATGPLAGKVIVDVVVRRGGAKSALALATTYVGENDAGVRYETQVYATDDVGMTWRALGTKLVEDARVETLEVAAADPHRVYVAGVRGTGPGSVSTLFVSDDDGTTWSERPIPTETDAERAPYIAAVDPGDADRIYLRTDTDLGSRLLVSDDGGTTYKTAFKGIGKMLGFALSPDGAKIFLGGVEDGLWSADKTRLAFTKRSAIHVQCLATEGTTLFACSDEASGFIVGSSADDGATFAPNLHIYGIRGPLACASPASAAVCAAQWGPLRDLLAPPDAATTEPPPDAGAPAASTDLSAGGGCAAGGANGVTFVALLTAASLGVALRRRRRRAPGAQ